MRPSKGQSGCNKQSAWKAARRRSCAAHKEEGMVDVKNKRCDHPSCNRLSTYSVEGGKTAEFCAAHIRRTTRGAQVHCCYVVYYVPPLLLYLVARNKNRKDRARSTAKTTPASTKRTSASATVTVEEDAEMSPRYRAPRKRSGIHVKGYG